MMVALHPERRPRFPRHAPCRGCCFRLVRSRAFERLVLLVIGVNTAAMALDGSAISPWLADALTRVNACCGLFFLLEMLAKITAFTARGYFSDGWNCFDAFVVLVSVYVENKAHLAEQPGLQATDWPRMAEAWGRPGPESATAGAAWRRIWPK